MAQVNVDTVIQAFIKLRNDRSTLKQAYDAEDEALKAKQERLETWLMSQMRTTGATQLGSTHGTAYQQTVMKGNCSDWPSFWGWLAENGRFDMMEKRISVKSIQEHYQETGEMPPGINVNPELRVVIRKAT
jgi:hypothetical protein